MPSSPLPVVSHPLIGRVSPAPTPRAAKILRHLARLMEYGDDDTLANVDDYLTFTLELLSARESIH